MVRLRARLGYNACLLNSGLPVSMVDPIYRFFPLATILFIALSSFFMRGSTILYLPLTASIGRVVSNLLPYPGNRIKGRHGHA